MPNLRTVGALIHRRFAGVVGAILLSLGLLVGLGCPIPFAAAQAAGAASPGEFMGITTVCNGVVEAPQDYVPGFVATLYNLPSGANPTASYTLTYGGQSTTVNPGYVGPLNQPSRRLPLQRRLSHLGLEYGIRAGVYRRLLERRGRRWRHSDTACRGSGVQRAEHPLPPLHPAGAPPVSAMATNPNSSGYWIAESTGKVWALGGAYSYGDMSWI